jgi:peptidyl-prolyl cis-trans isomerase B (cyclophilin B)
VPTNKQQREAAKRKLERQLERRQKREAQRRRVTLISTIVGTLVLLAIVIVSVVMLTNDKGKKNDAAAQPTDSASTSASPSPSATKTTPGECTYTKEANPAKTVNLPAAKVATKGTVTAAVRTTQGDLTFTMDRSKAPCTVASFESLAKQGYYNNTPCHRLTTTGIFVLQCGDPTGTGTGGPGYTIPDEYTGAEKYTSGVLAMANTGQPNSGGSQFFIVYKDTQLPPTYTVFGTVTNGLAVVQKVAAKGSDNKNGKGDGAPKLPIKITSVSVSSK